MSDYRRSFDFFEENSDAKLKRSECKVIKVVHKSSKGIRVDTPTKEDTNYYQSELGKIAPSEQS